MENNVRNQLELEVISPEGRVFKGAADAIVLPTAHGEITILPGHTPLFSKLGGGEVVVRQETGESSITISGGFLEILENKVNVLADYAIRSEQIEAQKATEAQRKAAEAMREKKDKRDFARAEKDLQKAVVELKVADKMKSRAKNVPGKPRS